MCVHVCSERLTAVGCSGEVTSLLRGFILADGGGGMEQ